MAIDCKLQISYVVIAQMWAVALLYAVVMCRYQCLCHADRKTTGEVSNKEQVLAYRDADEAMVVPFLRSLHGIISEQGYCVGKTKV